MSDEVTVQEFEDLDTKMNDVQRRRVKKERIRLIVLIFACILPVIVGYSLLGIGEFYLLPNDYIMEDRFLTKEEMIQYLASPDDFEIPLITMKDLEDIFHFGVIMSFFITAFVVSDEFENVETATAFINGREIKFRVIHYFPTSAGFIKMGSKIYYREIDTPGTMRNHRGISFRVIEEAHILENERFLERREHYLNMLAKKLTSPFQEGRLEVRNIGGNKVEK